MCKLHALAGQDTEFAGKGVPDDQRPTDILPGWVIPKHYNVWIAPSLDTFTFDGTVDITMDVVESTKLIVLNSQHITIHKASLAVGDDKQDALSTSFDEDKQQVTFEFAEFVEAGSTAVITVVFTGIHNDKMAGFYRSSYVLDGEKRYMLATQFESTDCRQAFPSFDEPALKATFDVTLQVDSSLVALSNMGVISTVEFTSVQGKNVKEVKFARTPVMSTYLVAFIVGDLEYIETTAVPKLPVDAQPITVRVYTTKGLVDQGRFALECGARTLEYFSEYFNEAYPLPKCDMVAVPDFSAGAMENWGLITYRNVYLLSDETSTNDAKKLIASIVGHELAHQWFGNLVTMTWWNDLWLNEGFATFVGEMVTDHLFPKYNVWTEFVTNDMSRAMNLDSKRSSHPIQVFVNSAKDIPQIFDGISYSKGGSLIRMLKTFLGGDVFMNGVRSYIQEFKYKNTVTEDLWKHLAVSSGLDIPSLVRAWTRETGYPLVSVEGEEYDADAKTLTVMLSQSRFLASGDLAAEEDSVTWWVPMTVATHLSNGEATKHVLNEKKGTITFPYDASVDGAFWKLNYNAEGLYRVKYQKEQVDRIGQILSTDLDKFSVGDRILILDDAMALTQAGVDTIGALLSLIKGLDKETDYNVLTQIQSILSKLRSYSYLEPAATQEGLKALGRHVFSGKVAELGYEFKEGESYAVSQARGISIQVAERSGDAQVAAELRSRFDRFVAGETDALHPEIRDKAYLSVLSNATPDNAEATFTFVLNKVLDPNTVGLEKTMTLYTIGAINSWEHIDRLLNTLMFDEEVIKSQDFFTPLASLANYSPQAAALRPRLISWLTENWSQLVDKYSGDSMELGYLIRIAFAQSIGEDVAAHLEAWVSGQGLDEEAAAARKKQLLSSQRVVSQVLEDLRIKTALMDRERGNLAAWIAQSI